MFGVGSGIARYSHVGGLKSHHSAGSEILRRYEDRVRTFGPDLKQDTVMEERDETRSFYGWVVVATAALGLLLGVFPIFVSSFSVFFPLFVREFHAGRGAVSLTF